jgi:hypothetical protein
MTKIFISAVTAQFKKCRDELASDLRAQDFQVRVQEDFRQGPHTLIERIEEYVAECDRVIAIVGDAYGFEPPAGVAPPVDPPRSYSQWEYFFASGERLDGRADPKKLLVYFASDRFLRDHPVSQPGHATLRQRAFAQWIKDSGKHWAEFDTEDELCRLALRDGWGMEARPHRARNLPYTSLGSLFKGRERATADLQARFGEAERRCVVVHGLGGIGKTRLGVEYALAHEADRPALLHVGADSVESLRRNLAAFCSPDVFNLPERTAKEEEVLVAATLRWLRDHPGNWLLILDNVDTPEAARAVEDLLPRLGSGHVLVTSRIGDWSAGVDTFELGELTPEDGRAFLLERTGRRQVLPGDDGDAVDLATAVEGLPLALEQAGAFIQQTRTSIAKYLSRWRDHERKVRTWHDERLMHYPRSLAVTWDATFEQLDASAQALLRLFPARAYERVAGPQGLRPRR